MAKCNQLTSLTFKGVIRTYNVSVSALFGIFVTKSYRTVINALRSSRIVNELSDSLT